MVGDAPKSASKPRSLSGIVQTPFSVSVEASSCTHRSRTRPAAPAEESCCRSSPTRSSRRWRRCSTRRRRLVPAGIDEVGVEERAGVLVELLDAAADERGVALGGDTVVDLAVDHGRRRPVVVVVLRRRARRAHDRLPLDRAVRRVQRVEEAVATANVDAEHTRLRVRQHSGGRGDASRGRRSAPAPCRGYASRSSSQSTG